MKRNVTFITALIAILATMSIAAIFTYKQAGGSIIWQDKAVEPGSVFFVNSTTGTNGVSCGRSPATPCASIDYAVGLCTASAGDVIYVMPGYNEGLGSTGTIDFDVAGITVIGLGNGSNRPRIDYDHASASVTIGADNVTLKNLTFLPSVTAVLIGIDVEAGSDFVTIENCEFLEGEDGSGVDEFVKDIQAASGTDLLIKNNVFRSQVAAAHQTHSIYLGNATSGARPRIEDNYFVGNYSTATIGDGGTAIANIRISRNTIKTKDTIAAISLESGTYGIIENNNIESTTITDPDAAIVAAGCSWMNNWIVSSDGSAGQFIGTPLESILPIGTEFYTTVTVAAGASVATGGMALTGASSGTLLLTNVTIQVGATALASANGTAALELYTDNAKGTDPFMHVVQTALTAQDNVAMSTQTLVGTISGATVTYTKSVFGQPVVLSSGKKIYLKADTQTFNAGGTFIVNLVWKRLSAGATVSAR